MGLDKVWGIHVGARADLLITRAEDPEDLVATDALERTVLAAGQVVSGRLG
jgi:cytosine/adenosine deaminase-related metal-dependent hydrolase